MENIRVLLDYQQADLALTDYENKAKDTPTRKKLVQIQRFVKNAQDKLAEIEASTKVKNGTIAELSGQYLSLVADMEDLNKDISYFSECSDEELDEKEIRDMTAAAERINDSMTKIRKNLSALKAQIDQDSKLAMQLLQKLSPKLHGVFRPMYGKRWFRVAAQLILFAVLFVWYESELDGAVYVMAPIV